MSKRIIFAYCLCLAFFTVTMLRLFDITQGGYLTSVADRQSSLVLTVGKSKGNIYDCNFASLTGVDVKHIAAVTPCPEAAAALAKALPVWERGQIAGLIEGGKPFIIEIPDVEIESKGIILFDIPKRINSKLAVHTTGYIDKTGEGVYGIEKAYNDLLNSFGSTIKIKYQVDAFGRVLEGISPQIEGSTQNNNGGIVLTIDSRMQEIAEAASKNIQKGAVVLMDAQSGDIKAMVSRPNFDADNLTDYLNNPDSPFINRCASAFAVGSSFKLAVTSAALESGIKPSRTYECVGYAKIEDQVFKCNNLQGHGVLNLEEAINKSCNTYFIDLATELGSELICKMAASMGFGSPTQLAEGLVTSKGNLPTISQLTKGELANFGFGQGKLTATPLQLAQMAASIANGGYRVIPRLVAGETVSGVKIDKPASVYAHSRIMSPETAMLVRKYMISTVENGSGKAAKPETGGAGGKTSSAQTGKFDEKGEIVHAWFTGFFPAEQPKYVCIILCEGGTSGSKVAAPVFKEIADAVNKIEKPKLP